MNNCHQCISENAQFYILSILYYDIDNYIFSCKHRLYKTMLMYSEIIKYILKLDQRGDFRWDSLSCTSLQRSYSQYISTHRPHLNDIKYECSVCLECLICVRNGATWRVESNSK